jgi:hypothetical protein
MASSTGRSIGMIGLPYVTTLLAGMGMAWVGTRPHWDDTGVTAALSCSSPLYRLSLVFGRGLLPAYRLGLSWRLNFEVEMWGCCWRQCLPSLGLMGLRRFDTLRCAEGNSRYLRASSRSSESRPRSRTWRTR